MTFRSVVWPEEPVPSHAAGCERCELSCHRNRMIWGEGNPEASIVVLLDNPGAREDREGKEFVCGTRETLQQAADECGFTPNELYVTYMLKCRPRKAYDKPKAREACSLHLSFQLEQMRPRYVFCLGNVALQTFLHNPDADVKQLRGSWMSVSGTHALASYHPLAVRRRPTLYRLFLDDWNMLFARYRAERNG